MRVDERRSVRVVLRSRTARAGVGLLLAGLAGTELMADDLSGYVEFVAATTDRESDVAGGLFRESESKGLFQTYSLTFEKTVYPNLRFLAGGVFRRTDATFTNLEPIQSETDSTLTSRRPFFKLFLDSNPFRAQLSYTRADERTEVDGLSFPRNVRETFSTFLGWRPDRAPSAQVRLARTNTYDGDRSLIDLTEDRAELTVTYTDVEPLLLRYRGNWTENEDRLNANQSETTSHNARIIYTDQFWNDRFWLTSDYNGTIRETETVTAGSGEVGIPLFPFAGLSAIDDTPDIGPLAPNPGLIDGATAIGAGINLGLPPPAGNDEARNIGLDFGVQTELNTLFVWVDRELPLTISDSFSWDIYTSTDNLNWVLLQTVAPGLFGGPFLPRFELRFADVTTRYIKVVTDPLSPAVPMATDYPLILVTELQASQTVPADQIERRSRRTSQIYNLNSSLRILNVPLLRYEFDAFLTDTSNSDVDILLANGLSLSHAFNKVYSVNARVTYEKEDKSSRERESWLYSAALSARPFDKWSNRLVFSGRNDDMTLGTEDRGSVLYNTVLGLYRGVDANLGVGREYRRNDDGPRRDSTLYSAILKLSPHRTLALNLIQRESTADTPVGPVLTLRDDSLSEANLGYTPLQSLYFFGSYRRSRRTGEEERIVRTYTFNWSPFPQGALRITFNYNESYRSDDGSTTSSFVPGVRWAIRSSSFLDVSYQRLRSDLPTNSTATDSLFATLRLAFF